MESLFDAETQRRLDAREFRMTVINDDLMEHTAHDDAGDGLPVLDGKKRSKKKGSPAEVPPAPPSYKLGHNFFPYLPPRTLLPLFHQEFTDRGFHHVQRSAPGATSTAHIFSCQEEEKKEREKRKEKPPKHSFF